MKKTAPDTSTPPHTESSPTPISSITPKSIARAFFYLWESPLWSMLLAVLIYALAATHHGPIFGLSGAPYYNYLADAFLHGQLALRLLPASVHDLVFFGGQYYLYWPPFPALMLMPFVAIFGVGFSDIAFTIVLGAVNVGLVAGLLRLATQREIAPLERWQRGLLVLFFAFGTVYFTLAPRGRVWFTGQLVACLCVLLTYISALRFRGWKAFVFAGLAVAATAMTRNSMIFAAVWPAYYLIKEHWPLRWMRLAGYAVLGAAPVIAGVLLLGIYNLLRFGSFTDVGLDYHLMGIGFVDDYHKYGAFHLHYLPINFYYQYIFYPFPMRPETFMGGSLFLLSPLFFAAFWAFSKVGAQRVISNVVLLLTILITNIPILLLMGTGYVQFGPRYTLDFIAPMLLLTAQGMRRWPRVVSILAVFVSIIHYTIGAIIKLP